MHGAHHTELIIATLLLAATVLVVAAQAVRVPYPIFLVIGGLALGLAPGIPDVQLDPDLVLVVFLPPLLYSAAFFSSLRDLRANLRPISLLALGLVLATTVTVAVVAHHAVGLPWASAFTLGAIVAPTDAIAATAIAQRLGVPRRIVTVIEGESLVNDSTALIAYRFAVAAVLSGSFSLAKAGGDFVISVAGGVAIGLAVAYVVAAVRRRLDNPPVEMVISLVTAYFAYLPAEAAGVSGVLAAVTSGIYLGWKAPQLITPSTRIQLYPAWQVLVYVLNTVLFILVGLQLPRVVDALSGEPAGTLIGWAALIAGTVIVTRLAWVFPFTYLPRRLIASVRRRDPSPPWKYPMVIGWAGMRGAVSLAAALALPFATDAGAPFPGRDLIVFLTFAVILATLVLQGLTLPALIRVLGIEDDGLAEREETKARVKAAEAAIRRIEELAEEPWVRDDTAERLRGLMEYRRRRFRARFDGDDGDGYEERSANYQRLLREVLEAQRRKVVELRNRGFINDEVMRRIEHDLDLEDTRLEI